PELLCGREQSRANFFARADVRDPEQKLLLEEYLLAPERTPEELQVFASIYPNANFMISNNLLTIVTTPTQQELFQNDKVALATIKQWLADARYAKLKPQLEVMRARLQSFTPQSKNSNQN